MTTGNTMFVSWDHYLDLKRTGRVTGDPQATAGHDVVYTDDKGVRWSLVVHGTQSAARNPMFQPAPRNRHERRARAAINRQAKAQAVKGTKRV